MAKHKTNNKDPKTNSTPLKKPLKAKCLKKEDDKTRVLARCKVWVKEQRKEKVKPPAVLYYSGSDLSDDEQLTDLQHEQRTDLSSVEYFYLKFRFKDFN